MLALAGRECSVFSYTDIAPVAFLWSVDIACRMIAFATPIRNCDWIINSTHPSHGGQNIQIPTMMTLVAMVGISAICSMILTVLDEMWKMWDPFGRGTNTFSWTLGIAMEIDNMVNEFSEYDTRALLRKHAYMDPSSHPDDMTQTGATSSSREQTVQTV